MNHNMRAWWGALGAVAALALVWPGTARAQDATAGAPGEWLSR